MTTRLDEITERIPREMAEVEERIIESSEQLRRKVDDFLTLRIEVESAECKARHQAIQARTDTHKATSEGEFKSMRADRETATDELYEEMKSSALLMSKNKNKLRVSTCNQYQYQPLHLPGTRVAARTRLHTASADNRAASVSCKI